MELRFFVQYWVFCSTLLLIFCCTTECSSTPKKEAEDCASSDHGKDGHETEGHGISIVSINIKAVETPLVIVIWVLLSVFVKVIYHSFEKFAKFCPESCVLIIVGLIAGIVLKEITGDQMPLSFDSHTFFLFLLPPIVFDAGYGMPPRYFFDNIGLIWSFAIFGTLINSFGIGLGLHFLIQAGAIDVQDIQHTENGTIDNTIDMPGCLLFGSLIAAVDPVAVLAVFDSVHVNEVLHIIVEGESLLNDAVSVVLYRIMDVVVGSKGTALELKEYGVGFIAFLVISCGGTLIGLIYAVITSLCTRTLTSVRVVEPLVVFFFAYLSYITAELFHWSGILAIIFCGFGMKRYVETNISRKSHTTIKYFMKMLAVASESVIFMFLGLDMVTAEVHINWGFIGWTIILCLVIRAIVVISFVFISNRFRVQKIAKVDQFIMVYGGLRGAISFSLAYILNNDYPWKNLIITTTLAVIIFTVFIQGITIGPLVKLLHVRTHEKKKPSLNEEIIEHIMAHVMWGFEEVVGKHGENYYRQWFDHIDNTYLMQWFTNKKVDKSAKHGDGGDILQVFHNLEMKDATEMAMNHEMFTRKATKGEEPYPVVQTSKAPQLPCVDESVALSDPNMKYQRLSTTISLEPGEDEHFADIKDRTFAAMKMNARPVSKPRHRSRLANIWDNEDSSSSYFSEIPVIPLDSHHSMPYHQHAPMQKPHHNRRHHGHHHKHSNKHHHHHTHRSSRESRDSRPSQYSQQSIPGPSEGASEEETGEPSHQDPGLGTAHGSETLHSSDTVVGTLHSSDQDSGTLVPDEFKMYDFGDTMPEVDPKGHLDDQV